MKCKTCKQDLPKNFYFIILFKDSSGLIEKVEAENREDASKEIALKFVPYKRLESITLIGKPYINKQGQFFERWLPGDEEIRWEGK